MMTVVTRGRCEGARRVAGRSDAGVRTVAIHVPGARVQRVDDGRDVRRARSPLGQEVPTRPSVRRRLGSGFSSALVTPPLRRGAPGLLRRGRRVLARELGLGLELGGGLLARRLPLLLRGSLLETRAFARPLCLCQL